MSRLAVGLTALVALIHIYIAWFEMFAWTTTGARVFGSALSTELFDPTRAIAGNQGLYNAFLAAGLIWSLFIRDPLWRRNVAMCFLIFVAIAGVYGAVTVLPLTIYVQLLPAILAMGAVIGASRA